MATSTLADATPELKTIWEAQPGPQTALIACPIFEVFFGGARGGGKTDGVLGDFLEHADAYGENAIGLMIRRQRTELIETIERSRTIYTPLGWQYHEQDKMWRAPNRARLRFAYLERDADAEGYMGHSYTRVYVEEIGNFPSERPILKLMATLRSGAGVPVGFRATGNPGGPGHQWVKARYIDPAPMGWKVLKDDETGLERVYIPSRVTDNKFLDDQYVAQLRASGSTEIVRAWLYGDWSVVDGAFFDCWDPQRHVVRPFAIPDTWARFRSGDWGSASPFSFGWWAIAGDDYKLPDGMWVPRGCMVRYREWYGCQPGKPNTGLKMHAEAVGAKLAELEHADSGIIGGVIDPSAFKEDGGPSIYERLRKGSGGKVTFRPADNARVARKGAMGGWDQMRARFVGDADGRPMIVCFSTCRDSIRTIPALQHDSANPEDVDTDMEDHCFTYDTVVRTDKGLYSIGDLVGTTGRVQSHDGRWHPFRSARLVKRSQPIVRLAFTDGSTITCTPDHKFMTATGWVEARDLQDQATLSLSARRPKSSMAFGSISAGDTSKRRAGGFTGRYGNGTAGRYLAATMSTTSMATRQTTRSKISNAFLLWNILEGAMARRVPNEGEWLSLRQPSVPRNGTGVPLAENGISDITLNIARLRFMCANSSRVRSAGRRSRRGLARGSVRTSASRRGAERLAWMTKAGRAPCVGLRSRRIDIQSSGHARAIVGVLPAHARGLVCSSVSDAGVADVYCLTVPSTGNFVLGNGAIVSNCADDWRYACMSRPYMPAVKVTKKPTRDRWDRAFADDTSSDWRTV